MIINMEKNQYEKKNLLEHLASPKSWSFTLKFNNSVV